jgi:hypothetical protein
MCVNRQLAMFVDQQHFSFKTNHSPNHQLAVFFAQKQIIISNQPPVTSQKFE